MPASAESVFFIFAGLALAGGVIWAFWTLRSADAAKGKKELAVACLALVGIGLVACLVVFPGFLVYLVGVAVLLLVYYVLLEWSNSMWK